VKLLLDTHTFLWHADADPRMSPSATALLADPANELFLSMATEWEIAIKVGIKKLVLSRPFGAFMKRAIIGYGLTELSITFEDCAEYEMLPFPDRNHRDPFDRMIITHALRHGCSVVGADSAFDAYGVARLW
jgi:PIN domain nuclease of toxin-antitoxin system